jgi:hypothetical protein
MVGSCAQCNEPLGSIQRREFGLTEHTDSFSRGTLLHGVSWLFYVSIIMCKFHCH